MHQRRMKNIIKFIILFLLCCNTCNGIYNETVTHLTNGRIKDICAKVDDICSLSLKRLCTVRMVEGKLQFREFENDCYLFLYNMCVYPGNEWAIKDMGSCKNVNFRRYAEQVQNNTSTDTNTDANTDFIEAMTATDDNIETTNVLTDTGNTESTDDRTAGNTDLNGSTTTGNDEGENSELPKTIADSESTVKLALRTPPTPPTTYSVDAAPDNHPCPYHCPSVYSPVCVNVNRGWGKYYRLLFFVNHCEADRHYCIHWATAYKPPPDEEYELVRPPSNAAWSYCAGNKYMNFATFAESASSLGHYGWLMGDQKPSHIMEPYERVPGFG